MKTIIFKKIELANFKGIRSLEVAFSPSTTRIEGANKTGKTTIADAVTWVLFGKDSKSRTQFGIKTREKGIEIPNVEHAVTLTLEVDGTEHVLRRSLSEKWGRMRGESEMVMQGNVTEYFIDGDKATMRDYQAFISSIVPEEQFRILTVPTFFTSLQWEEQRKILTKMCQPATIQEIAAKAIERGMDKDAVEYVVAMAKTKMLADCGKHLSYMAKDITKKLEEYPIKIEENNNLLPVPDSKWETADALLTQVRNEMLELRKDSTATHDKALSKKIEFANKRLLNIRISAETAAANLKAAHDRAVSQCLFDIESCKQKIKAINATAANEKATEERVAEQMVGYNAAAEDIRQRWKENGKQKLSISETDTICPTCGQPLPEDRLREHVEELKKQHAARKAETYKLLTEQATKVKEHMAQAEKMLLTAKADAEKARAQVAEVESKKSELEKEYGNLLNEKVATAQDILDGDSNYASILNDIKRLEDERDKEAAPSNEEEIKELQQQESDLLAAIQQRELHKQVTMRISLMREEQRQLAQQLAIVETRQYTAMSMQELADDLLEEQANKHFHFVQFKLFKTQVNGARVPFCEAHVDGVPFSDLNTAARINAGVDIISTLSEHYGISAPIVIDNAEAINNILPTNNQKIELYVTKGELTIK